MVRTVRGAHRKRDDGSRRRALVLALVAAAGTSAVVFASVAANRSDPAPVRVGSAAPAAPTVDPAMQRGCEVAVARGREAVAAAQPSYSHWSGHVRAQVDLDARAITVEQARERWAATKATADSDVAQFRTAYAAFAEVQGGCPVPQSAAAAAPVMPECRSEFTAVSAAVTAAKAVVDDWAAHVEMMRGKEHTDPQQYGQMWRDMVTAAPTNLARFSDASLELRDYVDCPNPT